MRKGDLKPPKTTCEPSGDKAEGPPARPRGARGPGSGPRELGSSLATKESSSPQTTPSTDLGNSARGGVDASPEHAAKVSATESASAILTPRIRHEEVRKSLGRRLRPPDGVGALELRARRLHLGERALGVPGLDLHAADCVLDDGHVEALPERVEDRVLDAVVGGESRHEETVDAALAEQVAQPRVLEAGVALAGRVLALVDDDVHLRAVERGVKLGAFGALDAVNGPDRGRIGALPGAGIDLDPGEGPVLRRMPVSRGDDEVEGVDERADRACDLVPLGDGERTPGDEVVLEVDDEKGVHAPRVAASRSPPGRRLGRRGSARVAPPPPRRARRPPPPLSSARTRARR